MIKQAFLDFYNKQQEAFREGKRWRFINTKEFLTYVKVTNKVVYQEILKSFRLRTKERMKVLNYKQNDLAGASGQSGANISKLLRKGRGESKRISNSALQKIALALGVSDWYLIGYVKDEANINGCPCLDLDKLQPYQVPKEKIKSTNQHELIRPALIVSEEIKNYNLKIMYGAEKDPELFKLFLLAQDLTETQRNFFKSSVRHLLIPMLDKND